MASWIFLRGLSRESGHWGGFVDTFQTSFSSEQVVLLDLPGNGALHQQSSPTHIHAMVDAYRIQLAQRGLAPPYHLLALSLGGMVAVAWAQTYPNEVAGLVLINTSMRPFSAFYQRLRPVNYLKLLRLVLASAHDQLVSVQCSLALAAAWHCAVRVHPWAGHDLPLDEGAWVAQQVAQWRVTNLS